MAHLYAQAIEDFVRGVQDWDGDSHVLTLLSSGYTPDLSAHYLYSQVSAWAVSSKPMSGEVSVIDPSEIVIFDADNVSWTDPETFVFRYALVSRGTGPNDRLIALMDFGSDQVVDNQPLTIQWDIAKGVFHITQDCLCPGADAVALPGLSGLFIEGLEPDLGISQSYEGYPGLSALYLSSLPPTPDTEVDRIMLAADVEFGLRVDLTGPFNYFDDQQIMPGLATLLIGSTAPTTDTSVGIIERSILSSFTINGSASRTYIGPPIYSRTASGEINITGSAERVYVEPIIERSVMGTINTDMIATWTYRRPITVIESGVWPINDGANTILGSSYDLSVAGRTMIVAVNTSSDYFDPWTISASGWTKIASRAYTTNLGIKRNTLDVFMRHTGPSFNDMFTISGLPPTSQRATCISSILTSHIVTAHNNATRNVEYSISDGLQSEHSPPSTNPALLLNFWGTQNKFTDPNFSFIGITPPGGSAPPVIASRTLVGYTTSSHPSSPVRSYLMAGWGIAHGDWFGITSGQANALWDGGTLGGMEHMTMVSVFLQSSV